MKKIKQETSSLQDWSFIDSILENGIIKTKNEKYIKILKINPINYQLKSELEINAILNSYKAFLKSYQGNIQIIIQSKKEDFSNHIRTIKNQNKKEKNNNKKIMVNLSNKYIEFINQKNREKSSSSKNFYILICFPRNNLNNYNDVIAQELQENYLKIKDLLARCGNDVKEINHKKEIKEIYSSFFNKKLYFYQ